MSIIEREDINNFENNRKKCEDRVDRVLFHGTSYDSISSILTDLFRKSSCAQHGKGVYFTEDIESCWIYGSEKKIKIFLIIIEILIFQKLGIIFLLLLLLSIMTKKVLKEFMIINIIQKKMK